MNWQGLSVQEAMERAGTSPAGLSADEAALRLQEHGPNELQQKKPKPAWLFFLGQFKDFMILVLLLAALISGLAGEITDTLIILLIVVLNACIGFFQDYKAERAMEALRKMAALQCIVLREGLPLRIPSADLVPGDIVLLEAGNALPADLRLLESHSLRIDESALTGESVPVDKTAGRIFGEATPVADRLNMAYRGTLVSHGRGRGLVVATGMDTEIGKIARMLDEEEVSTPLQRRMGVFGKQLSYIILLICVILFVIGLLRGEAPLQMLLLSISLAVAAIPEALPALITIALSLGAARLVKKQALVRKLPAVETLGSVSYICSDKTGTLTLNRMKVMRTHEEPDRQLGGVEVSPLLLSMLLNHDVRRDREGLLSGDPTEIALLEHVDGKLSPDVQEALLKRFPRVAELPFDSDRKCMSSVHRYGEQFLLIAKGASETLGEAMALHSDALKLYALSDRWAPEGLRVLAYGYRVLDHIPDTLVCGEMERELVFAGLAGLIDPPREEVKAAIRECKTAGITPVMITGDHPATAAAIAREIGILDDSGLVVNGAQLAHLDPAEFSGQVESIRVYARVNPEQKLSIVRALQARGHFVAMTGDGVNDAPSLKAANIGVAMGINGTDVSKEAAHMILLDDNFATIVNAVREGRRIYDNIRKFVKYIMTCNGAEIWTIVLAPLLGLPMPLLPIHILWINLVTDGLPGLALAGEKAESDVMKLPPRKPDESLFSGGIGYHIVWVGLLMAGLTLGVQAWAIQEQHAHWQTMVFTVLSLAQLGHVLGIRGERTYLFQQGLFSNLPLFGAVMLTFLLQLLVIYLPAANAVFKTAPLSIFELTICIAAAAFFFHVVEFEKFVKTRFRPRAMD